LDFATYVYTVKDESFKKTTQVVGGCQSGGGQFVCSADILTLHKSFGGLFDEIIMLMMVNYLIM
jgi:hypothetical protein